MPCTILCAADLWGVKVNYELPFQHPPTQAELQGKIDQVFSHEHALRRPVEVPSNQGFVIERMQTFDERAQQWVDLLTPAQLSDYSQIYLFQKENEHHREVQSKIPPPVPAPVQAAAPTSPTTGPRSVSVMGGLPPAASSVGGSGYYSRASSPQKHIAPFPSPTAASQPLPPLAPASPVGLPQTPAPMVPQAFATQTASQIARTVSTAEKQRAVFEEMDSKKGRAVDEEDFRGTFQRLRVEYAGISMSELFMKTDTNKDNAISYDEWMKMSEMYPTLLDSLYFRSRDYWTDIQQQNDIDASKTKLTDMREKEKENRMGCMQAQAETTSQEQKLAGQAGAASDAQARERDAKSVLEACHEDTERGRTELRDRIAEQTQQKDRERQKQVAVMEATREVEGVQRKLQVNEVEFAKAEETLREMERRVAEQRREVERQHACVDRTRGELATAQGAEHLANIVLGESQKDSQTASERVTMAEAEVTQRQEREREATACHRDSQSDTARQLAKRDLEERELHACREREAVRRVAEDESVRAVEEHEKYTQQLEHNNMELNVNRRQVEEEERPLLEQELKLRLLRESLEENEARLRTEHRSFHSAHGRGDTAADSPIAPGAVAVAAAATPAPPATYAPMPLPIVAASPAMAAIAAGSPYRHVAATPTNFQRVEAAPALSALPPPTRGVSPK